MRITGPQAAEEYRRRYGEALTDVDRLMIALLRDRLVEFDLHTEQFYVSPLGHLRLYQAGLPC